MFKVFAFLKRNTALLSHDDYRAGHVGYHCGQSRRLKNIRGYLVNVWSNTPISERLGEELVAQISLNTPSDFLEWWDGFPEVYFDDQQSWINATTLEPTRATAQGLTIDPDWSLDDGPRLFDPVPDRPGEFKPCHLLMHEHEVLPVERGEFKTFKLIQFFKLKDSQASTDALLQGYAPIVQSWRGCNGCLINFRDPDQDAAMRGFYGEHTWGHSAEGRAHRAEFCDYFDGAIEYHFSNVDAFVAARRASQAVLGAIDKKLMSACWYVEVDENLVVLPNRKPAPSYYYR